jgi:uncharacterized protein YneF (UPF0154 family)
MTQPNDPAEDSGRPRDPADGGESPPPPADPSSSYGSARPSDQPAFGPQYAYQYGQEYGGTAPPPMWPMESPPPARNGVGIAALVLGILAFVLSFVPVIHFFGMLLAVIAIILGIAGIGRARRRIASNRTMPIIGIILGVIALLIGAFWTYFVVVGARYTADCIDENPDASDQVIEQCITDRFEERFGRDLRPG